MTLGTKPNAYHGLAAGQQPSSITFFPVTFDLTAYCIILIQLDIMSIFFYFFILKY